MSNAKQLIADLRTKLDELERLLVGEAAPPIKLPLLPIVVGGVYRRRNGSEEEIIADDGTHFPFEGASRVWYWPEGQCPGAPQYDLVERIR